MTAAAAPGFLRALKALRDALAELRSPFTFIGGVAVIARGVARLTVDIDATVQAANLQLEGVFQTLARHDIGPRIEEALEFARERQVILAVHEPTGTPLDISLAWLQFEEDAIKSSEEMNYAAVRIPVAQAEDLVIYKLLACRPRDIDDAEKLLLLYGNKVRLERVRHVLREFCEVLEDTKSLQTLEEILKRTKLP